MKSSKDSSNETIHVNMQEIYQKRKNILKQPINTDYTDSKISLSRSQQIEKLKLMLNIAEINTQLISSLEATTVKKNRIHNKKFIAKIYESFTPIKAFSTLIESLPSEYSKRITSLHTNMIHQEYIYLSKQSSKLFNTPLSPEKRKFSEYVQNNRIAIKQTKRIIQILTLPTPSFSIINHYDKKNYKKDNNTRNYFIHLLKDNWHLYITKLEEYAHELGHSPANKDFQLKILRKIIRTSMYFLEFFQSDEVNVKLSPNSYFTLFNALEKFCKLCTNVAKKEKYLALFKEKYSAFIKTNGLTDTQQKLKLLDHKKMETEITSSAINSQTKISLSPYIHFAKRGDLNNGQHKKRKQELNDSLSKKRATP